MTVASPIEALLSRRLSTIVPSPSIAANAMVTKLRKAGRDIVNLTIGEPDLDTPIHIVQAAIEAFDRGDTHYTPTQGTPELLAAIVSKLKRDNDLDYSSSEVIVGSGGKHVIFHAFAATLNDGDEVIIPAPYWVSYPDLVRLHGATAVIVETAPAQGFKLTPEALEAAITAKTKWLVLNSPNNPTGAVYDRVELEALGAVLARHPSVLIMSDEIYEHFVYDGVQHVSIAALSPELRDRTLIVNGVSKGYAMTGWRLGYAAGPQVLIAAIAKLISQTTTCASSISQAAACAALVGDQRPVEEMRATFLDRRALVSRALADVDLLSLRPPAGAFYLFVDISRTIGRAASGGSVITSEADFVQFLLHEAGVAVVGGAAFGMSPFIRLSFATSPATIEDACRRIAGACAALV